MVTLESIQQVFTPTHRPSCLMKFPNRPYKCSLLWGLHLTIHTTFTLINNYSTKINKYIYNYWYMQFLCLYFPTTTKGCMLRQVCCCCNHLFVIYAHTLITIYLFKQYLQCQCGKIVGQKLSHLTYVRVPILE